MGLLKIEGHSDVMKDTETGAVININSNEIENARKRKAIRRQEKEEIENLKNEVSDIK